MSKPHQLGMRNNSTHHQESSIHSTGLDGNYITLYADDMLLFRVINIPQDFALRVCMKQWNLPYYDLLEKCNLTELSTQRNYLLSLGLLHKIINGDYIFPNAPLVLYSMTYFTCSHSANTFILPHAVTH